ncbi:hypothetical protein MTO96_008219 [Rhipicephalus appendiculatus]
MDEPEEPWKLKRTRPRYGSNSEPPPKSAKEGSDGRALFTGEDIQEMRLNALSANAGTLATVKFWRTKPTGRAPSPFAFPMARCAANLGRDRERWWNNGPYKKRAVSESRAFAAARARVPARSRSQPDSPDEECPRTPTLFDGVFKRPQPVSREPRRAPAQRHATKTGPHSSAVATSTADTLEHIAKVGEKSSRAPMAPVSPYLIGFSEFLHEQIPRFFPHVQSFERLVLDVRRAIHEEPAAELDSWCSHRGQAPCWLLIFQDTLARFLLVYDIEIAEIHLGTYSLHHVDSDIPKRANAEAIRERAREAGTEPKQFLHERECLITWLLRVHRCIRRVRLDLTAVAESPGEFCRGYRLHEGYKIVDIGVSGRTLLSGRHLFLFLGHVTQLTELSLFGLYLMHPDDNCRLAALVASNVNLDGLIEAAKGLPLLECFYISLLNPGLWVERSQQLSRLLAGPGCRRLKQAHFEVACDLGPFFQRMGENRQVVELQDQSGACHSFGARETLRPSQSQPSSEAPFFAYRHGVGSS